MTTRIVLVAAVLAAFIGLIVIQAMPSTDGPRKSPAGLPIETIKVNGETFEAEIAATEAARTRGLGGRTTIGKNEAMVFVHPKSERLNFWMKDCVMDIDIAFLDRTGQITAVHAMKKEELKKPDESQAAYEFRLKRYDAGADATYAIEFAPGTVERLGLKAGQRIPLDFQKLRGYLR